MSGSDPSPTGARSDFDFSSLRAALASDGPDEAAEAPDVGSNFVPVGNPNPVDVEEVESSQSDDPVSQPEPVEASDAVAQAEPEPVEPESEPAEPEPAEPVDVQPVEPDEPISTVEDHDDEVETYELPVTAVTAVLVPENGLHPAAPDIEGEVEVDAGFESEEPEALPVRVLPRTLAVANQKGGVGKTTTAVNLGAGLAEMGFRVLVIDLDPQGNATTGLGVNARNLQASIYDVLLNDMPLEDCVEATAVRNLFLAPATIDLAGAEIELVPAFSRELRLRRALERADHDFEFILIDCPPSLGLLTVNGLAAAGEVLVPIQCEYYALEGLSQLLRNVQLVQHNLNPRLELSSIVLTMYDARTKLADQVAKEVRAHFGAKVCRNVVPRTVRLSEAPSFGQPILIFDPTSRGAIAYRELAKEVSGGAPQRAG